MRPLLTTARIEVSSRPPDFEVQRMLVRERLLQERIIGPMASRPLLVTAMNGDDLVGVFVGRTGYGHLLVRCAWVKDGHRRQGIGRGLVFAAELEARSRGCYAAQAEMYSSECVEFFRAVHVAELGVIHDFPRGYSKHVLVKYFVEPFMPHRSTQSSRLALRPAHLDPSP